MGGDGGGILRHVNPQPPKTHAGFADAKVGRRRQPDTSEGASGRPPMQSRRCSPRSRPLVRFRHLHPVPAADLSGCEAGCSISRIPICQHLAHFRADPVDRSMASRAHRLQDNRPQHTHLASEINREAVDTTCRPAGVRLNQRRSPWRGCVGGIAEPIAGPSARNALAAGEAPAHGRGVRMTRGQGRSGPSACQALLQLSQQRVMHGQDDEIRARDGHSELGRRFPNRPRLVGSRRLPGSRGDVHERYDRPDQTDSRHDRSLASWRRP